MMVSQRLGISYWGLGIRSRSQSPITSPLLRRQRPADLIDMALAMRRIDSQHFLDRDLAILRVQPRSPPGRLVQAFEQPHPARMQAIQNAERLLQRDRARI